MYWHCGGGGCGGRSETARETRVRNFRREQVLGGITWRHRDSEFAWRHIIDHLLERNPQQSLVAFVVPYSAHCRTFLGRPSFRPALSHRHPRHCLLEKQQRGGVTRTTRTITCETERDVIEKERATTVEQIHRITERRRALMVQ